MKTLSLRLPARLRIVLAWRASLLVVLVSGLLAHPATAQQTFVVTTTADSGAGSLREAVAQANASPGADMITFNINGGGSYEEIFFESNIVITSPVEIDGNTQDCALEEGLCVRLDGRNLSGGLRLFEGADGSTIRGLVFTRFGADRIFGAIEVLSSDNVIVGNYFGTDRTGLTTDPDGMPDSGDELGNVASAIVLKDNLDGQTYLVENNRIGGSAEGEANVMGGGGEVGVILAFPGVSQNVVQGNFIGVGRDGVTPLGNGLHGISIFSGSHDNVIGGSGEGEGNLLMHNANVGILLSSDSHGCLVEGNVVSANNDGGITLQNGANGHVIRRNRVGTNPEGTAALPNGTPNGLLFFKGIGISLLGDASGNTIAENQVSGNLLAGILLGGFASGEVSDNVIVGNLVGLDASGQQALPNGVPGIEDTGAGIVLFGDGSEVTNNQIGSPESPNYIGGNTNTGILLDGPAATNNTIQSNAIGVAMDGEGAVPNGQAGIFIRNAAHHNQIGGSAAEANKILFNPLSIAVHPNAGVGNQFSGNVFGAALFEIDLGLDGPTANDPGDGDDGPNRFQNYADISSLKINGNVLTVDFQVDTAPENAAYPLQLQLYRAQDLDGTMMRVPVGTPVTYAEADAQTFVTRQTTLTAEELDMEDPRQLWAVVFDADGNTGEMATSPFTVGAEDAPELPHEIALAQNYPNPFNPATRIAYELPQQAEVRLEVFDMLGRRVALLADALQAAGHYEVVFDGHSLPSGMYLYRLQAGSVVQTRSMTLLK